MGLHKPCLSIGEYACESKVDLYNMLVAQKVDLVLTGHEHLYQRTHQLAVSGWCPALVPGQYNPACVVDSDSTMLRGAGTVIATVGTGGQALRDATPSDPEAPYFAAYSGANQNGPHGVLSVTATATTLQAAFLPATASTFTDTFTLHDPVPGENAPPTARFTSTCTNLVCTFDGSGSTDPEGPIQSYAWDFGDGATATDPTTTHTYAVAGTFPVTLTVVDGDSATGTTSRPLTVTQQPPVTPFAADSFTRTVTSGWGAADSGGPWSLSGDLTSFSVDGSAGLVRLAAGTETDRDPQEGVHDLHVDDGHRGPRRAAHRHVGRGRADRPLGPRRRKLPGPGAGGHRRRRVRGPDAVQSHRYPGHPPTSRHRARPDLHPWYAARRAGRGDRDLPDNGASRVWQQGSPEPSTWARSVTDSTTVLHGPRRRRVRPESCGRVNEPADDHRLA